MIFCFMASATDIDTTGLVLTFVDFTATLLGLVDKFGSTCKFPAIHKEKLSQVPKESSTKITSRGHVTSHLICSDSENAWPECPIRVIKQNIVLGCLASKAFGHVTFSFLVIGIALSFPTPLHPLYFLKCLSAFLAVGMTAFSAILHEKTKPGAFVLATLAWLVCVDPLIILAVTTSVVLDIGHAQVPICVEVLHS